MVWDFGRTLIWPLLSTGAPRKREELFFFRDNEPGTRLTASLTAARDFRPAASPPREVNGGVRPKETPFVTPHIGKRQVGGRKMSAFMTAIESFIDAIKGEQAWVEELNDHSQQ